MTLRKILALTCLLLPMMASAHQFETGQRVPPIGITDRGEVVLDKDQFSYKTWNSAQLVGKEYCNILLVAPLQKRKTRR